MHIGKGMLNDKVGRFFETQCILHNKTNKTISNQTIQDYNG